MFTGLIREIATVSSFKGETLTIQAKHRPSIGDSIAINGACLTVTKVLDNGFEVELSHESQKVLATENYRGEVHIEPAMRVSDRLEGHIVQGHVDCIGEVVRIAHASHGSDYYIRIPKEQSIYVVPKGSITIDGVSLTVNDIEGDTFRLTIIPHTLKETLISHYKKGTLINVETDMFARYMHHMFFANRTQPMSWEEVEGIMARY